MAKEVMYSMKQNVIFIVCVLTVLSCSPKAGAGFPFLPKIFQLSRVRSFREFHIIYIKLASFVNCHLKRYGKNNVNNLTNYMRSKYSPFAEDNAWMVRIVKRREGKGRRMGRKGKGRGG